MLPILCVLTFKVHPFTNSAAARVPENHDGVLTVYAPYDDSRLSVPTRVRKIVKSTKHVFGFYVVCVCIDSCALNAGECAHVCEGEARLMCRGEANTSTVALCLLARQA